MSVLFLPCMSVDNEKYLHLLFAAQHWPWVWVMDEMSKGREVVISSQYTLD